MGNFLSSLFGSSQTTQYQPPEELKSAVTDLLKRAGTQSQQPYPFYTPQTAAQYSAYVPGLVAPMTPNQAAAGQTLSGLQGYTAPNFAAATGLAGAAAAPIQLQQFGPQSINQYMSPYLSNVLNSAVANINQTNAQQQQQVLGNAIQKGAFGGDRAGIAQAELARQQALANNATIANILNQGYGQAQQQFNTQQAIDAAAQLQNRQLMSNAALNLANLGTQGQQAAIQQAQAQYGYGTAEQQQQQAGLSTAYQQFLNQYAYPYQQLGWYSQLASGTAPALGGATVSNAPTTSPLGIAVGGLMGLGALSNPSMQSNNPFAYLQAGTSTAGNFFGNIFGGGYNKGGRVGFAEGGVPVTAEPDPTGAYNDYVALLSSNAPLPQIRAAYQRYLDSFKGAKKPWEATTAAAASKADLPAEKATPASASTGAGGGGGGGAGLTAARIPDYERSDIGTKAYPQGGREIIEGAPLEVGQNQTLNALLKGNAPLLTGDYPRQNVLGDLGKGLGQALSLMSPLGILSALNRDPKVVAEEMGKMYGEPNRVAAEAYDDAGNRIDFPNTASGQNLAEYMAQMGIEDPSEVRMGMTQVNGRWQPEFFKDSTIGRMLHPNSVPALDVPGVKYGSDALSKVGKEDEGFAIPGVDSGSSAGLLAASGDQGKFFELIRPYAEDVSSRTGIDPRVIMAQAALESAYGKSAPGGNLFGIKSSNGNLLTTKEFVPGQGEIETKASFAKFPDLASAFQGYEKLMQNPRYAGVTSGQSLADQIKALGQSGYATDPAYAAKISSIANRIDFGSPTAPQAPSVADVRQAERYDLGNIGRQVSPQNVVREFEAAQDRGGGRDRDTSMDRGGIYSEPAGPSMSDFGGGRDSDSGGGAFSSSYNAREQRGGRIHKAAAGGITMQYGLPTEEDLQRMAQSFAGSGAGTLPVSATALAAKGVLPSKNGGRIHAANGVGVTPQDPESVTLGEAIAGLNTGQAPPRMGGRFGERPAVTMTTPGGRAAMTGTAAMRQQAERSSPENVVPKLTAADFTPSATGRPVSKGPNEAYSVDPTFTPTATASTTTRTEPVVPKAEQPAQREVAPGIAKFYNAPPPADLRNLAALNFAARMMSPGPFGVNLANAANAYAQNILAQQEQQRSMMTSEATAAQNRASAQKTEQDAINAMINKDIGVSGGLVRGSAKGPITIESLPMLAPGETYESGSPEVGSIGGQNITSVETIKQNPKYAYKGQDFGAVTGNETNEGFNTEISKLAQERLKSIPSRAQLDANRAESTVNNQQAQAAAQAASEGQLPLNSLATAVSNVEEGGVFAPGATAEVRFAIMSVAKDIARVGGIDLGFDANLSDVDIMNKIRTTASQLAAKGNNPAARTLETIAGSFPNIKLQKATMDEILANMYTQSYMDRVYAQFSNKYVTESAGAGNDGAIQFNKLMPPKKQAQIKDGIKTLLGTYPLNKDKTARVKDPKSGRYENVIVAYQKGHIDKEQFNLIAEELTGLKNMSSIIGGVSQ